MCQMVNSITRLPQKLLTCRHAGLRHKDLWNS